MMVTPGTVSISLMKVVPMLGAAVDHRLRHLVAALAEHGFFVDLVGDAELLQQAGEIVAGGAAGGGIAVGDAAGGEQRLLEGFGRGNVGRGRAFS